MREKKYHWQLLSLISMQFSMKEGLFLQQIMKKLKLRSRKHETIIGAMNHHFFLFTISNNLFFIDSFASLVLVSNYFRQNG